MSKLLMTPISRVRFLLLVVISASLTGFASQQTLDFTERIVLDLKDGSIEILICKKNDCTEVGGRASYKKTEISQLYMSTNKDMVLGNLANQIITDAESLPTLGPKKIYGVARGVEGSQYAACGDKKIVIKVENPVKNKKSKEVEFQIDLKEAKTAGCILVNDKHQNILEVKSEIEKFMEIELKSKP